MKLEVGMYCRHKNSIIGYKPILINKIIQIIDTDNLITYHLNDRNVLFEKDIIKASHNIIDLIEIGDYVNGELVVKNTIEDGGNIIIVSGGMCYTNDDIKTILTHEQFENNCFKIGE